MPIDPELNVVRKKTDEQKMRLEMSSLTEAERDEVHAAMHHATSSTAVNRWVVRFLIEDLLDDQEWAERQL